MKNYGHNNPNIKFKSWLHADGFYRDFPPYKSWESKNTFKNLLKLDRKKLKSVLMTASVSDQKKRVENMKKI